MTQPQLQATFDMVVRHLLAQGRRAYDEHRFQCQYRTRDGLKCAVGCLIPDEVYTPRMEGGTVGVLVDRFPGALGRDVSKDELRLLSALQSVHDTAASPWPVGSPAHERLLRKLGDVAELFRLTSPDVSHG